MAQTKRKRRTKHRGTQAGTVESRGRTSRPTSRAQARQQASRRKADSRVARANTPPTWRAATYKGAAAAGIFMATLLLIGQPPLSAILVGAMMIFIYVPLGYYLDLFIYRRGQRKLAAAAAREPAGK